MANIVGQTTKKKMMWTNEFINLDELKDFLINQINYDESNGFTFLQIR